MFYWDKNNCGYELEDKLYGVDNIKEIFIATAYLSNDGVDILEKLINAHNVKKDKVCVCLSTEFSYDRPADILTRLDKIANVRISKGGRLFHSKVYYLKGETDNLLIFGSSNLTDGGFYRNIEFDRISKPSEEEKVQVENFIKFCLSETDEVTDEYINFYKSQEAELCEIKRLKNKLKTFENKDDAFTENEYDLEDFYFKYADYETFFLRNIRKNTSDLSAQRKVVKDKLMAIHNRVQEDINKLNLYAHKDKNKITSSTFPNQFNNFKVEWMGVRYGKKKEEIYFGDGFKESYESFTKHACLQFNIYDNGFELLLFFAVPNEAWDRNHLKNNLEQISDKINLQAQAMRGHGLVWHISDCPEFNFDTDVDLAAYLKKYDCEGKYSYLARHFAPNNPKIKTIQDISNEVLKCFKLYKPLYDIIVWRKK